MLRKPHTLLALASLVALAMLTGRVPTAGAANYAELVDPNPAVGNRFGHTVRPLASGNIVVTSPFDDAGGTDAGAVYLFNGATGALISTLRGSHANDYLGVSQVTALANGNFVVSSPYWNSDAGAVTWGSGTTGVSGVVSSANSLVGSSSGDNIGSNGVTALTNGNYVVCSYTWDNGPVMDAGAVTWGSGTTGVSGFVSAANSLVGTLTSDYVGNGGARALSNGNYVVSNYYWHSYTGAVTWGHGATGVTGVVSAANSLVGSISGDGIGTDFFVLPNGNYVVNSFGWSNGAVSSAGAVTWGNGATGTVGAVSAANSLVGSSVGDQVGAYQYKVLSNGNYVICSPNWDNGAVTDAGAVTLCSGTGGTIGSISAANSLVGATTGDHVGGSGAVALTNGNFVALSPSATIGGKAMCGAATWGSGTLGVHATLSASNSLTGSNVNDGVGAFAVALTNGNYVVMSPYWSTIVPYGGALTLGNGTSGTVGAVSAANSLVGSSANDNVGTSVTALANGNFVATSSQWDNGAIANAGAATWGSGTVGVTGSISAANSLVGSSANDQVGSHGLVSLPTGNYVVLSASWSNGALASAGAVTFGLGVTGVTGTISPTNSLVGGSANDLVGSGEVIGLPNGHYVVTNPSWDNLGNANVGAVTWCRGDGFTSGLITAANSLIGSQAGDFVGNGVTRVLANGDYVITSSNWHNGPLSNAGAATWAPGGSASVGTVNTANSLVGTAALAGLQNTVEDTVNEVYLCAFITEGGGRIRVGPPGAASPFTLVDVPADQGGWLRLTFGRAGLDFAGAATPIAQYGIWRRLPGSLTASADNEARLAPVQGELASEALSALGAWSANGRVYASSQGRVTEQTGALPPGTWELVATVPALQLPQYVVALPTISNAAANEYVVTAHTTTPSVWFTSATISGQSIDNLAPAPPSAFTAAYASGATQLQWSGNTEHDLGAYRLYRGASAGFVPSLANRLTSQIATNYSDVGLPGRYYKLSAVDVNGNESGFALVTPASTAGVEDGPVVFALTGFATNPASARAMSVSFALPTAGSARIELLDVTGRRVLVREVGLMGAGRHVVDLGATARPSSGIYWLRLSQGDREVRRRVTLLD